MKKETAEPALIRFKELKVLVQMSRTTIWRKMKLGAFPKKVDIGSGSIAWMRADVEEWLKARQLRRAA